MADLDDFFAKKDKKKSKGKKFLTADELVKNLEDTTKRETTVKAKKPESNITVSKTDATGDNNSNKANDDVQETTEEEWKEFEEEQRKDYTGLKIGQLTVNDDDEEQSGGENDYEDGDSDGNTLSENGKSDGAGGPWKKVIPAEEVTQIPMEKKVYVSPALRHSNLMSASRIKSRKTAPDITNAEYFPTLGAARPEEQRKKKNEPAFEEVRHGSRVQRVQESAPAPVAATNRFQSLDEDAS